MNNSEQRKCQNCKKDFVIEPEDFDFYKKIKVPPPTWCPECRLVRRLVWRNERCLYKRNCDLCSVAVFSAFAPQAPYAVYCVECYASDKWDAMQHGRPYDWNKSFFEQWRALFTDVPQRNLYVTNSTHSPYGGNMLRDSTRIYLSYSLLSSEDVFYSKDIDTSRSVFDSFDVVESENVFQGMLGYKNYNCDFIYFSRSCLDSRYLYDCVNCRNCFMCTNLRNKEFYIKNAPCTKEEYKREINKIDFGSYKISVSLYEEFLAAIRNALHKYAIILNCSNCTGNDLINSKNARVCFSSHDIENVKFAFRILTTRDAMDLTYLGINSELLYECQGTGSAHSSFVRFNIHGFDGHNHDVQYSANCGSSSHLFGCVGIRNKQYCILNRQYSKEEYEALAPKIIAHMDEVPYISNTRQGSSDKVIEYKYGEFFPIEFSPFAYNETLAQEYFSLTEKEVDSRGYRWRKPDAKHYSVTKNPEDLADHIKDADDSVCDEVIGCAHNGLCKHQCTTAFRVLREELQYYKSRNVPLPRLCPNCRHYERLAQRNPLKLWHRRCSCNKGTSNKEQGTSGYKNTAAHFHGDASCPNELETPYAPERKETVYCESCYNAEIL
ncbi:MAG: hypothetical protein HYW65_02090 [Candidatus Liptonbacteria bacterium]|nr:hypothetical protein [Candidatus Liptonbacteria bacterium]